MGYAILEFIKRLGIFLICAQSLIHFTAGRSYEKYVRLLIGLMVLAQFAVPVRGLFLGRDNAPIGEQVERFRTEIQETLSDAAKQDLWADSAQDVTEALKEEIREKLAPVAAACGCRITEVTFSAPQEGTPETSQAFPEGEAGLGVTGVTVTVKEGTDTGTDSGSKGRESTPIKVNRIKVRSSSGSGGTGETKQAAVAQGENKRTKEDEEKLKEAFASRLGTEKEYVEIIYE